MAHRGDMQERRSEAWARWRRLLSRQSASGQSAAAFCRQYEVSQWQFYAWRKRLRQAGARSFVEVQLAAGAAPAAAPATRAIEIRLAGEIRVWVEPGFDAEHLRAVVAALEARN